MKAWGMIINRYIKAIDVFVVFDVHACAGFGAYV